MAQGIDSEYDCTQYAHQIAEKYTFVGRYYRMPPPYSHYPTLTRLEAQALSAAGLSLASIWEYISGSQGRIESLNYNAGVNEGGRAYKQALALPQPDGTPIYFAVDEGYDRKNPNMRARSTTISRASMMPLLRRAETNRSTLSGRTDPAPSAHG
jgi:hypothetical protein